eukprot:TRINITY_DN20893_c0_g1_i1.p2 TRINITY_DN20893_c0_g1~~TRINITY_DN20893_c0_g1_i1.p2  ORF type:complete len:169 (+),score=16.97 TRINITY_DN20893_c0_g1_i1:759-1265(+)
MGQAVTAMLGWVAAYPEQQDEMKTSERASTTVSALNVEENHSLRIESTTLMNLDFTALHVNCQVLIQFSIQHLDSLGNLEIPVMRQCNAVITKQTRMENGICLTCRSLFLRDEGASQAECDIQRVEATFAINISQLPDQIHCELIFDDDTKELLLPSPSLPLILTSNR